MKKTVPAVVGLTFLAGCATGPRFENYTGQDATCIEGDVANFFKFAVGEAHVHIQEIDGVPTGGRTCVPPGTHRVGISAHNKNRNAYEYIGLDFEPGKSYKVRADLRGITFTFRLLDITDGQAIQLTEFRAKVANTSSPAMVPIIIPARR